MSRCPGFVLSLLLGACAMLAPATPASCAVGADLAVPPLRLATPVSRTLPNGLRVVVLPETRLPIAQVQLRVAAGFAQEPDSVPGLAALTAEFMRFGTTSRSADEFASELALSGDIFNTWAGRDYALVDCALQAKSLEHVLELMSDAVVNPLFGGADFSTYLNAYARKLQAQRQAPVDFADQRAVDAAFAPHPYSHSAGADIQAILDVTPAQVQAFHRDHWRPDRAVLVIAGDVAPERAFALATDWFGNWSGRAVPDRACPAPQPHVGVRVVDMPQTPRVEVRVAVLGPGMAKPGYASWSLAQSVLESGLLPPGVKSTLVPARDASLVILSATASAAQAAAQAQRMIATLSNLATSPPSGPALDAIRHRVALRYPLGLETLGAMIGQWQMDDVAGLPADEFARAGEHAATADLAPALALLGSAPVIVVVGPADSLRQSLAVLGSVEVVSAEARHASAPDTLPTPTAEQARRGREAIVAAVAAHGGAAVLKKVGTLALEGQEYVYKDGKEIPSEFSQVRVDPDRFSMSNKVFQLESRQVMVGNHGWAAMMTDSVVSAPLDSVGVKGLRMAFQNDLVHELRSASAGNANPALRGTEIINQRACDLVDFAGPYGHERFAIDSATHRVVAIDTGLGAGPVWHVRRVLSDFHPVNGVLLPYGEDRLLDGERNSHVITRVATVNDTVDPHLFDPVESTKSK